MLEAQRNVLPVLLMVLATVAVQPLHGEEGTREGGLQGAGTGVPTKLLGTDWLHIF
jgi:hypothetical protein